MTGRSLPEWIGATPDARIPDRVKLRIWEREDGRCWITGHKIRPGDDFDFDHKVALCNGGTHSESNLAPALRDAHRKKTAADVAERAKTDRIKRRHLGIRPKSRFACAKTSPLKKKINGEVVRREDT